MDLLTLGVIIGIIAGITTVLVALAKLVKWLWERFRPKPKPPVIKEEPEPRRHVSRPPHHVVIRFIDRHDEQGRDIVELVVELLEEGQCINLWGSGGVGKTTLAIEATHRVFPAPFSGGVIWASADGRADYSLVTLLNQILTTLGREDARTLAPAAKADLVGHLLSQSMPCLLGLDNFETIAREERKKILAFLAGVSCPFLLTSRMRLSHAQNIRMGPMTPKEANQFLQSLVRQSTERAKLERVGPEEIAKVAERNPMLMRWVVAQLEEAMRAQDVFDKIGRGKGEAPERIFNQSFERLGDDGQMALLALALFVPTASREALASVCGFEDGRDRVNEAIRRLAAFALLDTTVDHDRLGIVALTRRLTEAQLKKDERTEALKEHFVAHFLTFTEAHPEVTKKDLDALDDERENLLAALGYAYAAEAWESVMRLADEICRPTTGLLGVRGYWDEAIKWGERALEAARRMEAKWHIGGFSDCIASLHLQRGNYEEAGRLYEVAIGIAEELGADRDLAASLGNLGIIAQLQGDYQEAKDLYYQSLEIEKQLGNQAGIAKSLHQLGIIAQHQRDYQEAKDLYYQSLEIEKQLGDQAGIASSLSQLGILADLQGDYDQARGLQNQSLDIRKELGDKKGIAICLHQLGMVAQGQSHYQEAKDLYNQSLQIKRNLGDQAGVAKSLGQLGTLAEATGKVEEAAQLYAQALAIFERIGSPEAEKARRALARVTGKEPKE